jgi:predicted PurR-regulated permease PerM
VVTGALFVTELIAGLLLALVLLFFVLKDGYRIWDWIVSLVPGRRREGLREVGSASWSTLGHYLRGVASVALFDAVTIGVALAILGVPLVLPLAVLTFFGAFFPLVGAFTAGFVAALVALVSEGVVTALIVVGVITAIQQLEGDVIYPVLVGRQIRLHPVAILLVLTAGAVVAGIVGALFAVPAAAVAWTAIQHVRGERKPSDTAPAPGVG